MKSKSKKIVLSVNLGLSLILLLIIIMQETFCYDTPWCRRQWSLIGSVGEILLFIAPLLLLFSLITFWMKEEVFQRWFRFAVWYIPLFVFGVIFYPDGGGMMAGSFDALILFLLLSIFVITSIIKIIRAHKNSRQIY